MIADKIKLNINIPVGYQWANIYETKSNYQITSLKQSSHVHFHVFFCVPHPKCFCSERSNSCCPPRIKSCECVWRTWDEMREGTRAMEWCRIGPDTLISHLHALMCVSHHLWSLSQSIKQNHSAKLAGAAGW